MKAISQVFTFDLLSKVILGVSAAAIIRYMPKMEYAQYTLALSVAGFVSQILASTFNILYVVGDHRVGTGDSTAPYLGFQLVAVIVFAILGLPLLHTVGGIYVLIVALVAASCLSDFSKTIYQKEMKFLHFSIIEGARAILFAIGVLLLLHSVRYDLKAWYILLLQAAAMLPSTFVVFWSRVEVRDIFHLRSAWRLASHVIKGDYRFLFGYFAILALYSQTDVFLMKILAGDVELAVYGSALRYYMLLLLALGATHAVLLPSIKTAKDIWELHGIIHQYRKMLFWFVPIVILGAWASGWIIPWIDQGKYPGAVLVFRILAVSSLVSFAFSPYVSIVIRHEEFRFLFLLILSTFAFSLALNGLLIPRLGGVGAALTNLFSYGFLNGLIYRRASRRLDGGGTRT